MYPLEPRPIDGNALYDMIQDNACHDVMSVSDVLSFIENVPTLDYAPVKRGKWMPWYKEDKNHKTGFSRGLTQLGWWCSACHGRSGIRTKFCPNCGAKMEA